MEADKISTRNRSWSVVWRALGKDFAWVLAGMLLLTLFIILGEYAALPSGLAVPVQILRLLLGLIFVLYVPGYCLTAALFAASDDLDGIERTGLSLGLSVAWIPVLALILDRLPWGLRLWPILLGEMVSILLFRTIALWRRARLPAAAAYAPEMDWRPRPWWRSLETLDKRIYLLCAAALLFAGAAAAWIFLVPSPDEFMTEFYILGEEGLAESYPREAQSGEELNVTMGITNREREPLSYRVEIWAVDPWTEQRQQVGGAEPLALAPGETVEQPLTWSMPWSGQDQIVEFYLYTATEVSEEPYRKLRLWLNVSES